MIVKFNSTATASLIMFDDVARKLLKVIGKEATARGVITPEEMPEALARLGTLVAMEKQGGEAPPPLELPEVGMEPHELVALGTRAKPLIKTLGQALAGKAALTWEAAKDFGL